MLGHLGLPTDIPEARAPPLHLVGDPPPIEVAGSSTNRLTQPVPHQRVRRVPQRLESRLTAARRFDRMPSVEACNPRVGAAVDRQRPSVRTPDPFIGHTLT